MSDTIKDGKGTGYLAEVTKENKLRTYATTESEISFESATNERAYTWTHSYDYDANDTILLLKNTSTTLNLLISEIVISSDTTTQFIVHCPTGTTLAGTAITAENLNRGSNVSPDATAIGDETGNTQANIIEQGIISANTTFCQATDGAIVLQTGDEIAVDLVTAGTLGMVTIKGYYHSI